jgi:hypothetical protein
MRKSDLVTRGSTRWVQFRRMMARSCTSRTCTSLHIPQHSPRLLISENAGHSLEWSTTRNPAWGVRRNKRRRKYQGSGDNSHFGNGDARDRDRGPQGASLRTFRMSRLIRDRKTIRRFAPTSRGQSHVAGGRPISTSYRRIRVHFFLSHRRADRRQRCRRGAAPGLGDAILWIPKRRRNYVGHGGYGWGRSI